MFVLVFFGSIICLDHQSWRQSAIMFLQLKTTWMLDLPSRSIYISNIIDVLMHTVSAFKISEVKCVMHINITRFSVFMVVHKNHIVLFSFINFRHTLVGPTSAYCCRNLRIHCMVIFGSSGYRGSQK